MERSGLLEYLRIFVIAFVIAIIINLLRILIFANISIYTNNHNEPAPVQNEISNIRTETNIENHEQAQNPIQAPSRPKSTNKPKLVEQFDNDKLDEKGRIQIALSPRLNLSGMSKAEILNLRKQAVNSSPIFKNMNYEPSSEVFGSLTDNLPWISVNGALHESKVTQQEKVNGFTRDSIGILNPELLYYVLLTEYSEKEHVPFYKPSQFFPYKVLYRPETKTIIAYIKGEKNENGVYEPIWLADSNAHDLGYHYAYMDSHRNIGFFKDYNGNTLASGIKDVSGYYMHGSACGIPGGCNNYAPYWQYYNHFYIKELPAKFNIKLWKNKPANPEDEADINFKMFFY